MFRYKDRAVLSKVLNDCERVLHDVTYTYERIPPFDEQPVDVSASLDEVRKKLCAVAMCLLDGSTRFIGNDGKE